MLLLPGAVPPTNVPYCVLAARLSSSVCILGGPVNQRANEHVTQAQPIRFSPEILMQVLFSSVTQLCHTLFDPMDCRLPGLPNQHQLPEFTQTMSIESVMLSNHLLLCRPLLLPPSIFPSIRIFSKESVLKKERKKEKLVPVHPRNDLLKDAGGPHCRPSRSHHASVSVGLVQLSLHFCECMVLSAPVCLA